MAFYVNSINPSTNYYPGSAKTATISIRDTTPIYDEGSLYGFAIYKRSFYLFTASTSGTNLGKIGDWEAIFELGTEPSPLEANASVSLTVPSGTTPGTYYVGGSTGTRASITVAANTIAVSFDINTGSGTTPSPIIQVSGSIFYLPNSSAFYKTGYSCSSWNTAADGSGNGYALGGSYVFTQNTVLYAKWVVNQYGIFFNSNGGTSVNTIVQDYGTTVTAPANPTKTGYTFAGWYSDSGLIQAYTFTTMPANNITLYAKWTINQYTISFEENGGTTVSDITQDYGSAVSAPTPPTKTGYTFNGWYGDEALTQTYSFTTMPLNGKIVYAKWTINSYYVKFFNGTTELSSQYLNYNTIINAPSGTPTKSDLTNRYIFLGWNTDENAGFPLESLGTVPANNINFYAIYQSYESAIKIKVLGVNRDVNLKLGTIQVKAVYKGNTLIWKDYNE